MIRALAFSIIILAHSWYPPECCSGIDCKPVSCEDLEQLNDGKVLYKPGGYTFAKSQVSPSQDANCHVCARRCVFILSGV